MGTKNDSIGRSRRAEKTGTCEVCGAHGQELGILAMTDFLGWACEACRKQLAESIPRRWCGTTEETEPGE